MVGIRVSVGVREPQRVAGPSRWRYSVRGVDVQIRISQLYALHSGCSSHVVLRGIPRRNDLQECQFGFGERALRGRTSAAAVTVQWQVAAEYCATSLTAASSVCDSFRSHRMHLEGTRGLP
jgi:hypothetical protein